MLKITIPARQSIELWDEQNEVFITIPETKEQTLRLEHSLVSLSKWESKWCKPFLSKDKKSTEETIDYVRCMTLTQNVDPNVYESISNEIMQQITQYIDAPMTATWFSEEKNGSRSNEQITSELIYYWMISCHIPCEYQKWHLNRLLTLIRICNIKQQKPEKMSQKDIASQYAALNAARRQKYNTTG